MKREASLLRRIHRGLPPGEQMRYAELIERRRAQTLSEAEHRELLHLNDRVEQLQVQRVEACIELARLRGVSFAEVIEQLRPEPGLSPSAPAQAACSYGFRHLGLTLRALRRQAGISQAELARRARCGKGRVSKIEAGQFPNVETLDRLLAALDVTPLGLGFALAAVDGISPAKLPRQPADLTRRPPATLQLFASEQAGLAHEVAGLTTTWLDLMKCLFDLQEGRILAEARRVVSDTAEPDS
jgi:transcriptional regulator with XRE-family HTH domain